MAGVFVNQLISWTLLLTVAAWRRVCTSDYRGRTVRLELALGFVVALCGWELWWSLGIACDSGDPECGGTVSRSGEFDVGTLATHLIDVGNALAVSAFDTAMVSLLGELALFLLPLSKGVWQTLAVTLLLVTLGLAQNFAVVLSAHTCVENVSWAPFAPLPHGAFPLLRLDGRCPVTLANQIMWIIMPLLTALWVHVKYWRPRRVNSLLSTGGSAEPQGVR